MSNPAKCPRCGSGAVQPDGSKNRCMACGFSGMVVYFHTERTDRPAPHVGRIVAELTPRGAYKRVAPAAPSMRVIEPDPDANYWWQGT